MRKATVMTRRKKHDYIDVTKLRDFSLGKSVTVDTVAEEFRNIYKITNIGTIDFEFQCICWQLADDYANERANYKTYIEKGMNARLLMELRNSAILPLGEQYNYFYTDHCKFNTPEEIRAYRDKFISSMVEEYVGEEWQYYVLLRMLWGRSGSHIAIDFEPCFADGEDRPQRWRAYYRMKFLEQHLPNDIVEWMYLDDDYCY